MRKYHVHSLLYKMIDHSHDFNHDCPAISYIVIDVLELYEHYPNVLVTFMSMIDNLEKVDQIMKHS